jgi:D-glycero-alpha-D-manno-heptose 1-phosphate guanylyltransferase
MIREAIILAGGLGTRLRDALPDLPKCMAPVNDIPFIDYVISNLQKQGIEHFILALGHRHEPITKHIAAAYPQLKTTFSVETEPLGTGGAILLACQQATEKDVLIANGDTLYAADTSSLASFHRQHHAVCTLALKPMKDFDRYGVVETDKDGHILSFLEKKPYRSGLINGGMYALHIPSFLSLGLPKKCSFEKDFLEKFAGSQKLMGIPDDAYFIDIGIPEDYKRAAEELPVRFPNIHTI